MTHTSANYAVALFNFFSDNEQGVNDLISHHQSYKHFYDEYIKVVQPLKPEMFALLLSKSSYGQIALAFNSVYRETHNTDPDKLIATYMNQLISVFAMNLFFSNFMGNGLREIFDKFPSFEKEFLSLKQHGVINFLSSDSFWKLFFKASPPLQQELTNKALELYGQKILANIYFNLNS